MSESIEGAYATVLILLAIVSALTWIISSVWPKKREPLPPPNNLCNRDYRRSR